ncbi:MAG: DUF3488 domain-containing protein [Verrucomicrobiaceae bacterium]|nr:DUF3488 domain-containing protein [Verrucomicrobiaceae bacterium]
MKLKTTWHTLTAVLMLVAMWYAAEAQSNGAAYLLGLLAGLIALISVLHARANLSGLRMRVRAVGSAHDGAKARVRVEISNDAARPACGIEVQVVGAQQSVFIDQLGPGQSRLVDLPAPKRASGTALRLLARSAYPLGLFSMERVTETATVRRVHPRPAGKLPLPAMRPFSAQDRAQGTSRAASSAVRGGDDFAGTREFQPGDSPRHIDWRAVARGRPLVVKTWASSASGSVELDWDTVPLPEGERAGQIARWIELCERDAVPYALRLPGAAEIQPGCGDAHARRCLDALADFLLQSQAASEAASGAEGGQRASSARVAAGHETTAELPRGPFWMLAAALVAAMLPLLDFIAAPCLGFALLCMIFRVMSGKKVPSLALRIFIMIAGVVITVMLYSGQSSMEAGMALLVTLAGVKMLESRVPREFQVLALIGWFLCLCILILDNSLPRTLWCLGVFLLICACMVRLRSSAVGMARPLRLTATLFLQAVPLVVLLFMLLPRGVLSLNTLLSSRFGQSGISSELDPGSITQMAMRLDKAFRVEFPGGQIPANELRYWRCLTLTECRGFSWRKHGDYVAKGPPPQPDATDLEQTILLEPHGAHWLPALDVPLLVEEAGGSRLQPLADDTLYAPIQIRGLQRYKAWSRPLQRKPAPLAMNERRLVLQLPAEMPPRVRQLALQFRADANSDLEIVNRGVQHIQQNGFKYTLTPDEYTGPDALEQFLFEGRNGFCEHFAASFATLMRIAGVPSRVVIGFLGGEYSEKTRQMIVRQSDAHAWVEVWLEDTGWTRLDPTAALAPGRVENPLRGYLTSGAGSGAMADMGTWDMMVFETRLFWDRLNFAWQESVVEYDEESQQSWLASLAWLIGGGRWWRPWHLLGISFVLLSIALLLIYRWLSRRAAPADPWARAWLKLCEKLRRAGFPARHPGEGPLHYAQRIRTPQMDITPLAENYATGRYGAAGGDPRHFSSAVRQLRLR